MRFERGLHALLISGSQVQVLVGAPFNIKHLAVFLEPLDLRIGGFFAFCCHLKFPEIKQKVIWLYLVC